MDEEENHEYHQFEELIQGLMDKEYGCCNDFMLPNVILGLMANLTRLNDSGKMNLAGIGNKTNLQKNKKIRGDKINWIESQSNNQFESDYLKKIGRLMLHLNNTCFTSLKNSESHYATYEKNTHYKRHIDQFKTDNGRKFSLVLYLNDDWKDEDGGTLSLYPKNKEPENISPLGGRMVFFKSDEMEHEVNASFTRSRNSIAGWLKN